MRRQWPIPNTLLLSRQSSPKQQYTLIFYPRIAMPNKLIPDWRGGLTAEKPEQVRPSGAVNGSAAIAVSTPGGPQGQQPALPATPVIRLYSDYVRCMAALAVVTIHSSGAYLQQFDPANSLDIHWWTANIYCSLLRWATPFFILLSGSVFLRPSRPEATQQFLLKRVRRVVPPFIFWGLVYTAYQYRGTLLGDDWPTLSSVLHLVFFEDVYYHLWFIPMIIGLYLLTPVFRIFIQHARRSDIEYFLVLAFTITALQHLVPGLFIVKYIGWLGYIGFYVLGYYLSAYTLSRPLKRALYALGLAMPLVTALGTWWLSLRSGAHDQTLYVYFSPNVIIMTAALFTWLRESDWSAFAARWPRLDAWVHRLAGLSFGVYFVHVLILDVLKNGYLAGWHITSDTWFNQPVFPLFGVLLQAATAALLSVGLIWGLSKVRGVKKWLM